MTHPPTRPVPGMRDGAGRVIAPPRDVLEAVRRREAAAMSDFFDRYFDLVYGIAFRLTGNREAAEDVTQDVFLKVQSAAPTLDADRDPAPWLVGITTNAFRDRWRSVAGRMQRASVSLDGESGLRESLPGRAAGPEEIFLGRARDERVQSAIARLPEGLREVVVLHAYLGWSHDRIGDALGATHVAVRKRYSRGLAALAGLLEDLVR
jgi:RNA polymerase sigma factor (sigma-70 family)